jgi:hypothetical protein
MGLIYILLAAVIWFKYRSIKAEVALVSVVAFLAMLSASLSTAGDFSRVLTAIPIGLVAGALYAAIGIGIAAALAFAVRKLRPEADNA